MMSAVDPFTLFLYLAAAVALIVSWLKSATATKKALRIALKSFLNIMPDFSAVLALVGLALTLLAPATISHVLGRSSGVAGLFLAAVVGSITLIPGFVAFPLAKSLLDYGAGIPQIALFVSTLMMVGVITAPMEIKFFSRRETIARNGLSLVFSFLVAAVMGVVLK